MSVTITITVSPEAGAAEVRAGAEVTGEAPPPTLLAGAGETAAAETAEAAAEGPPPLEPEELGLSAAAEIAGGDEGPPPQDVEVGEADTDAEAPEPMAIEVLEE